VSAETSSLTTPPRTLASPGRRNPLNADGLRTPPKPGIA
jgi:hypothetical protein